MTFYEIAEERFIQHTRKIGEVNLHKSTHENNKENFEQAKKVRGHYNTKDFLPWIFHASEAKKVVVHYTAESGKEPNEVNLKWTQSNGELDEKNHIYSDDIERVSFIKDEEEFWV
jgi:hypothetical protein